MSRCLHKRLTFDIGFILLLGQIFMSPLMAQGQTKTLNPLPTSMDIHVCGECHGENGNPKDEKLPIIWGQSAVYLEKQLRDYRSGQRENQIMNSMAESVPKKDLGLLSQAIASKAWPQSRPQPNLHDNPSESTSATTKTDAQTCLTCHAQNASGESFYTGAPRLYGQNADYLLDQMLAWMNQDRNNSEVMSVLLKNKTKEQAKALALYFAFH